MSSFYGGSNSIRGTYLTRLTGTASGSTGTVAAYTNNTGKQVTALIVNLSVPGGTNVGELYVGLNQTVSTAAWDIAPIQPYGFASVDLDPGQSLYIMNNGGTTPVNYGITVAVAS